MRSFFGFDRVSSIPVCIRSMYSSPRSMSGFSGPIMSLCVLSSGGELSRFVWFDGIRFIFLLAFFLNPYAYKLVVNIQPVVKEQPVVMHILFSYRTPKSQDWLHVNAIYKELVASNQIAKNKNRVIEALNDLEESDLSKLLRVAIRKKSRHSNP